MSSLSLTTSRVSGNYNDCQPLFVDSLRVLLVAYGSVIQSVSVDTGELLGKFTGHARLVSCITAPYVPSPQAEEQQQGGVALSSSLDGVIYVWRIKDFSVVSRLDTNMPVYKVIIPQLAVSGNFLTGQETAESRRGCDELYLVVGKSPKSADAAAAANNANTPGGRKRSIDGGAGDDKAGVLDRFKLVMFDTAALKVRRKVSTLRSAKQTVCSIIIDHEEHVVVASKRRILVYSTKTRQGPKITNSTGAITCVAASQVCAA